jgi:hypothetical protein
VLYVLVNVIEVTLVLYQGRHIGHIGSVQCSTQRNDISDEIKGRTVSLLSEHTPKQVWMKLWHDGIQRGIPRHDVDKQIVNMRRVKLSEMKSFAALESIEIAQKFPTKQGESFIIDFSLAHEGDSEVFILIATNESLQMLYDHGKNIFFMDGMHKINHYKDNQIVTINVRVGMFGYPVAYLITCR